MKVKSELNLQKKFRKKIYLNKDKNDNSTVNALIYKKKDLIYANN